MSNKEFIRKFAQGVTSGKYSNLRIDGDKLINYSTVIATRVEKGVIDLNVRKYSRSTTNIQNILKRTAVVRTEYEGEPADIIEYKISRFNWV